jgi:tRNA-splicing ligase RtcB
MAAVRTSLSAGDLPSDLKGVRAAIERAVPHGFTTGRGRDKGSWEDAPGRAESAWRALDEGHARIQARHPKALPNRHPALQLGTLGSGNHFIEVCLDGQDQVWFVLHSGSRGVGNRIGMYFIERAREEMQKQDVHLPDRDLAYLREGTQSFDDYVEAVGWAQAYALTNRRTMMDAIVEAVSRAPGIPPFRLTDEAVNCHHNYVVRETHYGQEVLVTRKGTVRAGAGDLGIIPGSMGARSYIVRGKGNPESFLSCSHGAGRALSRNEAKRRYTVADHEQATAGVECRKDAGVIDETPAAYKPIDAVMAAQRDLVDVVHELKQVVCVKG